MQTGAVEAASVMLRKECCIMIADQMKLEKRTFEKFCGLIYDKAGITLGATKESLVSARGCKRMRKLGLQCFKEYYELVDKDEGGEGLVELLNAISTNTTHFYREEQHFTFLTNRLLCIEF